jgi:hypothetical protein
MKVREIIKDSLKYPLTDWKKFLFLAIIFLIIEIIYISRSFGEKNVELLVILTGIAFLVGFLVNGYIFRIINASFDGKVELPVFDNWVVMGLEGAKVYIVYIIYLIPTILLLIYLFLSSYSSMSYFGISAFDFISAFNSVVWQGNSFLGLIFFLGTTAAGNVVLRLGIIYPLGILYSVIITPIFLVAIANMVYDEGDLKSAFKIREIFEEISIIGWGNLIKWYVAIGIIFMIFAIISTIAFFLRSLINPLFVEILIALILYPYFTIFLARSLALFYLPEEED